MPLPGNVSTGTVTGQFTKLDGSASSGEVIFVPSVPYVLDASANVVLTSQPLTARLDATGAFSKVLVATNDADLNPLNWTYYVRVALDGQPDVTFSMSVLGGQTVDIADIAPAPTSTGVLNGSSDAIDPAKYGFSTTAIGAVNRAALQMAIDEACGAVFTWDGSTWVTTTAAPNPVTSTRIAARPVRMPGGAYLFDGTPVNIRSVLGLVLEGSGHCELIADANTTALLDINGACLCKFRNFTVRSSSASAVMDNGIYLYWDIAGSLRSTTLNHFTDIWVSGWYKVGIRDGRTPDNGGVGGITAQCDNDIFEHVTINGAWTAGETTLWQEGLHLGTGTYGNNLVHHCYKLQCNANRYNLVVDATQVGVYGGGFTGAEADIKLATTWSLFSGIRSELSDRFILGVIAGYAATVTISDLQFEAQTMHADGQWIKYYHGGVLRLEQIQCRDPAVTPVILATPGSTAPLQVQVDGFVVGGSTVTPAVADCFSLGAATSLDVRGFAAAGASGAMVSTDDYHGGINAQVGTTYTFARPDDTRLVTLSNALAITATVPPNSTTNWPVGTEIDFIQLGAGQVTVAPGAGVTVNGTPGLKLRAQFSRAKLVKTAINTWLLSGDIAA